MFPRANSSGDFLTPGVLLLRGIMNCCEDVSFVEKLKWYNSEEV